MTIPFWVCWATILAQFGSKNGNCKCQIIIFNVFYSVSVDLKSHNWYACDGFYLTDPSFLFYWSCVTFWVKTWWKWIFAHSSKLFKVLWHKELNGYGRFRNIFYGEPLNLMRFPSKDWRKVAIDVCNCFQPKPMQNGFQPKPMEIAHKTMPILLL